MRDRMTRVDRLPSGQTPNSQIQRGQGQRGSDAVAFAATDLCRRMPTIGATDAPTDHPDEPTSSGNAQAAIGRHGSAIWATVAQLSRRRSPKSLVAADIVHVVRSRLHTRWLGGSSKWPHRRQQGVLGLPADFRRQSLHEPFPPR